MKVLATTLYGEDAAFLYVQTERYYLRTGKLLYRMVLAGSRQEMEQALARGAIAAEGRTHSEVIMDYHGPLVEQLMSALQGAGIDPMPV